MTSDPEFVRAWAELAGSLSCVNITRQDPDSILRLEEILERIRTLDPSNPYRTTSLVSSLMITHRYDEAIEDIGSAPVDDFELSILRSVLELRDHRDPRRRLEALGMAAAGSAAAECIRSGLVEPSQVMPFVEPYPPYYDSLRDQPAFVDLLAEIQTPVGSLY